MESVELEVLGKKYYFRVDNPATFRKHAALVIRELESLEKKFNTVDQRKLFLLCTLMITEKYFNEVEKNKSLTQEIERINALIGEFSAE